MKTITTILLAAALVAATAAPAAADSDEGVPRLLRDQSAAIVAGVPTWVNVLWVADGDIDDFRVTATAKDDAVVDYSVTTGDHAGPMNGYDMAELETDFTAFLISVPEDFPKKEVKLDLLASWTTADGERETDRVKLKVPVAHYEGTDWQVVDDAADLGAGWVEIPVLGLAPRSEDVRFSVADAAGVTVYLPQETWTGPHHDAHLDAGESDVVRFHVEPGQFSGAHEFVFEATWARSGERKSMKVPFTVDG